MPDLIGHLPHRLIRPGGNALLFLLLLVKREATAFLGLVLRTHAVLEELGLLAHQMATDSDNHYQRNDLESEQH